MWTHDKLPLYKIYPIFSLILYLQLIYWVSHPSNLQTTLAGHIWLHPGLIPYNQVKSDFVYLFTLILSSGKFFFSMEVFYVPSAVGSSSSSCGRAYLFAIVCIYLVYHSD